MTREEAIYRLNNTAWLGSDADRVATENAVQMAIEALKAQLSAKDATLDDVSTAYENGYKQGKFEALQWIPCNERMPEVSDYYLIQHSRRICQDEMAVAFYSVEEAELDKNYTWEFKPFADCKEVIAWMSLPSPYQEDES